MFLLNKNDFKFSLVSPPVLTSAENRGTIRPMAAITRPLISPSASSHVRPFNARRDMGAVADLIERCFLNTLDEDGQRYLRQMREMARNPGIIRWVSMGAELSGSPIIGYVWEDDGQIIANVSLVPYRLNGRSHFLIANVAVHPDHRRQGIASNLTWQAVEHARARGALDIWLHVREENDTAFLLYQELGFTERARRTTWRNHREFPRLETQPGIKLGPRLASHWPIQKTWLDQTYPPELCWHLSLNQGLLRPGFWGAINRLFSAQFIQQWAAQRNDRLQAVASWQATSTRANALWLAAPPDNDEEAVLALLIHARRKVPTRRPLVLDYPAHQHKNVLHSAGFYEHQTLIWMRLEL